MSIRACGPFIAFVLACVVLSACSKVEPKPIVPDRAAFIAAANERTLEILRDAEVAAAVVRCLVAVESDDAVSAKPLAESMMKGGFSDLMALGTFLEPLERAPGVEALADEAIRKHPDKTTREELKPILDEMVEERAAAAARAFPDSVWVDALSSLDTLRVVAPLANALYDEIVAKHLRSLQPQLRTKTSPQHATRLAVARVLDTKRYKVFVIRVLDNPRLRSSLASGVGELLKEPTVLAEIRASLLTLAKTPEVPELLVPTYSAVFEGDAAKFEVSLRALLQSSHVRGALNRIVDIALSSDTGRKVRGDLYAALATDPQVRAAYADLMRW